MIQEVDPAAMDRGRRIRAVYAPKENFSRAPSSSIAVVVVVKRLESIWRSSSSVEDAAVFPEAYDLNERRALSSRTFVHTRN